MRRTLLIILFVFGATTFAADSLIDRWASALGGRDKIAAIKAIYREATIEVGPYQGTIKVWHTADGKYRKEEKIATFSNTEAFDGTNGTIQQGTTPPRKMTDREVALTRSKRFSNWNAIFFVLFPEHHHGTVTVESENTISFTPEGGVEWRVTIDPQTSLPKAMMHKEADQTITIAFESYETVDGIQFEKEIHRAGAGPHMDSVIRFTKTVINPPVDASLFSIR